MSQTRRLDSRCDGKSSGIALVAWRYFQLQTADQVTRAIVRDVIIEHGFESIPTETEQLNVWRANHPGMLSIDIIDTGKLSA